MSVHESQARPARHLRVMEPGRPIALRELWEYRDLVYFLTWRDFKVRYTQSIMGVGWAVGQPLLMMGVFALIFGVLMDVPGREGIPYPVLVFSGLVPWTFFASAVSSSSESLVGSANMVQKVYFPRLAVPIAALLAWLPDLGLATVVLVVIMGIYGMVPTAAVVFLPLFILFAIAAAAAAGLWMSALNVAYRDIKHVVPFVLQAGMFTAPVVYSSELLPQALRPIYGLNPMTGVIEGFRWALLGQDVPSIGMMLVSGAALVVVLAGGIRYFRRVEQYFADVV